jgi:hypothetical protein
MLRVAALAFVCAVRAEGETAIPSTVDGASFFEPFLPDWESKWTISKDAEFTG